MSDESKSLLIRLPKVMNDEIKRIAQLNRISVNGYILNLLSEQTGHDLTTLGVKIKRPKKNV